MFLVIIIFINIINPNIVDQLVTMLLLLKGIKNKMKNLPVYIASEIRNYRDSDRIKYFLFSIISFSFIGHYVGWSIGSYLYDSLSFAHAYVFFIYYYFCSIKFFLMFCAWTFQQAGLTARIVDAIYIYTPLFLLSNYGLGAGTT